MVTVLYDRCSLVVRPMLTRAIYTPPASFKPIVSANSLYMSMAAEDGLLPDSQRGD